MADAPQFTHAEIDALVSTSVDVVLVFDRDGRVLKVSAGAHGQLYRPAPEQIGRRLDQIFPPIVAERFLGVVRCALDSGRTQQLEYQLEIDGEERIFAGTAAPTTDATVVWIARNVSEQRRAEEALRSSEAAHRELLAALPVIIYWVAPTPPYIPTYVSPGIEALGYKLDEWLKAPNSWIDAIHPDDRDRIVAETDAALAAGRSVEYEYRMRRKDGTYRWMHDRGEFLRDHRGEPLAWRGVMIDVTDRRALEDRVAALSEEDELTHLMNRRGFRRMAERALKVEARAGRRVALMFFDVDRFKTINDSLGHAAGDRALCSVAAAMRASVRDGDLVARFGGDEFVVLAFGLGAAGEGEQLGRRVRDEVARRTQTPDSSGLSLSYGVTECVGDCPLDHLLSRADADLYSRRTAIRATPDVSMAWIP